MEWLRLRLLLPSIALIVVATMIPAGFRPLSLHSIAYSYDATDFVNNILLYLPLGIALGGASLPRALVCGFSLSTFAELLQIGFVDRIPSPVDVLSNTCGAMLGYLGARAVLRATSHDPRSLPFPRPVAAVAVVVAILGAVALVYRAPMDSARRPHLPGRVLSWLPQPLPIREIELGGAEALLSGLLAAGILGCFGVPRKWWLRGIAGLAAGAVIGSIVWIVGVSAPRLGLRILLESMVAGLTVAVSAVTLGSAIANHPALNAPHPLCEKS